MAALVSTGPQSLGAARDYLITLSDGDGNAPSGFTGSETFSVKLWPGDTLAPVWSSTSAVTWVSTGSTLKLSVPKLSATVSPAPYYIQIWINPGTDDIAVLDEGTTLTLTPAPGTTTAGTAYCTFADVLDYCPWIFRVIESDPNLESDLGDQRIRASRWVDETAMARARWILEDQERRHSPVVTVDPIEPTSGVDMGPWWGPSIYHDTTLDAQLTTIQGYLDDGNLTLSPRVIEAAARYAVYLACTAVLTPTGENPYREIAGRYHAEAMALLRSEVLRLSDGTNSLSLAY